ncbi:MAG TPA: T9SS type A sorting domain-containing protein [Candidatus Kapabacteria bacterium]
MRKFSFVIALLFVFAISTCYGQGDSCIVFWPGTTIDEADTTLAWNPDSTHVDTCATQPPYRIMYCRSSYHLTFDWRVINSPVVTDTALVYEWTDIDTLYPSIRNAFQSLEAKLGHFTLTKAVSDIEDTSIAVNKLFVLVFDDLVNVDTAMAYLTTVPHMKAIWRGEPRFFKLKVFRGEESRQGTATISIERQPGVLLLNDSLPISQVQIYSLRGQLLNIPIKHISDRRVSADISALSDGVYFVSVNGQVVKFIK